MRTAGRGERLAAAVAIGLLALWVGLVDTGDPTPEVIRWPIVALVAIGLAWWVWWWSGEKRG